MDSSFKPWIAYPPLTEVRLSAIATILRDVRQEAVAKHEPDSGDSEWSLGCRIYSRSCFAIKQAAKSYDWLTILPELEVLRFSLVSPSDFTRAMPMIRRVSISRLLSAN
jgi:hypothetical protein